MNVKIKKLSEYIEAISNYVQENWTEDKLNNIEYNRSDRLIKLKTKWFRGQEQEWPMLPKILRKNYNEVELTYDCRRKLSYIQGVPEWLDYASWLFLMQHHNLPTRLLDFSESAGVALFFSLENWIIYKNNNWENFNPIVWILNPNIFNWIGFKCSFLPGTAPDEKVHDTNKIVESEAYKNILISYNASPGIDKPVAIAGKYVHIRMQVQNSRFIVWGKNKQSLNNIYADTPLFKLGFIHKFEIDKEYADKILTELKDFGICRSTLFPDFEGIAKDLEISFLR